MVIRWHNLRKQMENCQGKQEKNPKEALGLSPFSPTKKLKHLPLLSLPNRRKTKPLLLYLFSLSFLSCPTKENPRQKLFFSFAEEIANSFNFFSSPCFQTVTNFVLSFLSYSLFVTKKLNPIPLSCGLFYSHH